MRYFNLFWLTNIVGVVLILVFFNGYFYAQTSNKYNSTYVSFYRAENLFAKQQYGAARQEFGQFIGSFIDKNDPLYIKARYYQALSAIELYHNDAISLFEQFLSDYPESIYHATIHFRMGNFYYREKKYAEAVEHYTQFWVGDLDPDFFDEYYFKIGYAHFQLGNIDGARAAFFEIKNRDSHYANPALYYFSHIAYTDKNYQSALEGFLKLDQDDNFKKVVPLYILQIYHIQHRYQEVINYIADIDHANFSDQADINRIIGDSYYRLELYDEAVAYLEKYNHLATTNRSDDYQLGYAYYRSGDYTTAIRFFDRVAAQHSDSLAQIVLYHIGAAYLVLENDVSARSAFQKAFEINADKKIQEEALYQFAVLSYKVEVDPYNEAILAFETFLNNYPYSPRRDEVYQYLVNVYSTTNNYRLALESLERIETKDFMIRKIYQEIAYNYGIELYQKGNYQGCIPVLSKTHLYSINAHLDADANYWIADAHYQLKQYNEAIKGYKTYLRQPGAHSDTLNSDAYYNIAYAFLHLYDTLSAVENFRIYEQRKVVNKEKLGDTYMRIADSYFMQKENQQAINYYHRAIQLNITHTDQALYYKALTHGVINEKKAKISDLLNLVNNYVFSKYVPNALFEIAFTYKITPDYDNAIRYFLQLLSDYPNTDKEAIARVEMADAYYKQNQYKLAEEEYLYVLEKFQDDTICSAVGDGLQHIYAATKQIQKLEQYASQYPCLNINSLTLENLVYNPAEADYFEKKYMQAIPKFENYMEKYPQGFHIKKTMGYLADSYYETDQIPQAIQQYELILQQPNGVFSKIAAIRTARYYYNNKQFEQAIPYYLKIEEVSEEPDILFNTYLGLMRSYYQSEQFNLANLYAKKVVDNKLLKPENRIEAHYILGMSSYQTKEYQDAITALNYVSKNTTLSSAAEAKFTVANIYFQSDQLDMADKTLRELLKMKPSYDFWIAKAIILQTKILIKKQDLFQAQQTISSVIEHYPNQEDGIKQEAQTLYNEIMAIKEKPKQIPDYQEPIIEISD